jgi:HPt (histidine-containing phosphotransfer) domain-containing protein
MNAFITIVHGMKSSLLNIDETELSSVAYRLEQAGNNKDFTVIADETPALMEALRTLTGKLKPKAKNIVEEMSHDDEIFLKGKLAEIKTACERFNKKSAKKALDELKQKAWPSAVSDLLDETSVSLLRGEFKKIVAAVEAFSSSYPS